MATLETQYKNFLKDNPDSTFSFNEWKQWHGNEIKQALTDMQNKYNKCKATDFYDEQDPRGMSTSEYDAYMKVKKEQKQHIVDLMKIDEELGLYDEEIKPQETLKENEFCHYSGLPSPTAYEKPKHLKFDKL